MKTSRNYGYLFSLLSGIITIGGNLAGGHWVFMNLFYSLVFLAIIEWFLPEQRSNEVSDHSIFPDAILIVHFIFQVGSLTSLFYSLYFNHLTGIEIAGAGLSTGIHSGTSALVVAHEMIHRKKQSWLRMGKLLLFSAGNIYFFIEHLRIHHKWVGTDRDPATARFGENLYTFFIRSITGQISGAWKLEAERMKQGGKSSLSWSNYVFRNLFMLTLLFVVLFFTIGITAVLAFFLQALTANFLLEYTNYIEHYGLVRNNSERVIEEHSWQSDKIISRFTLIDLSRHSDHHHFASKPYHTLNRYENSPVLPGGYASALYLALIPRIWFKVINPRLEEFRKEKGS
jgi:alkane 1-monooxygenase